MWFLIFYFSVLVHIVYGSSSQSCYYQRCLGCRSDNLYNYKSVQCDPSNWVSANWASTTGGSHPPPWTASEMPIEYRCLKVVATPDDAFSGNTLDVFRGCVPLVSIDSTCLSLVAIERARGRSDARCFTCRGNNCNHSHRLEANFAISISVLVYFFKIKLF